MSALEPPIERLNYFNGERLDARDLRAEQEYHIRVRRLVNRLLYSTGIVRGLEVTRHPSDKHRVVVAPGLAFDSEGREIVLLDRTSVQVVGVPSSAGGFVLGNFLVISYSEERRQPASDACRTPSDPCGCEVAWRGPTRIQSQVRLEFLDTFPDDASGRVVLGQVELKQGCEVAAVHSGVRKYAVTARPPTVRSLGLEGEKDIDASNPKTLYFHVDGGYPENVTLYLRGALFSTLFYTEVGGHTHAVSATTGTVTKDLAHTHGLSQTSRTSVAGSHTHNYYVDYGETTGGIDVNDVQDIANNRINTDASAIVPGGDHDHEIGQLSLDHGVYDDGVVMWSHSHTVNATAGDAGANVPARGGVAYTYVADLQVWFDGADITARIRQYLTGRDAASWPAAATLGDGTAAHVFVTEGTKDIPLLQIVDDVGPGDHRLELRVTQGGGKVHYNLYVE
jgi:hypothetical protein